MSCLSLSLTTYPLDVAILSFIKDDHASLEIDLAKSLVTDLVLNTAERECQDLVA